jgi:hypothetical protein
MADSRDKPENDGVDAYPADSPLCGNAAVEEKERRRCHEKGPARYRAFFQSICAEIS